MADVKFGVDISLDTNKAIQSANTLGSKISSMSRGMANALKPFAIAGMAALTAAIGGSITAAIKQERVLAQMSATLKSTGFAVGLTKEHIVCLSAELQKTTGVGDEVIQSGQNMLLTFTQLRGEAFDRATKSLLDMNTAFTGGKVTAESMQQQAIQLGKALNNPVEGLNSLARVGVKFTDEQKNQIKSMVAMNDVAGAQAVILKELETEFGGSAEAIGKTFGGQVMLAKNNLGDLGERIGRGIIPTLTDQFLPALNKVITKMSEFLTTERIAIWVRDFSIGLAQVAFGFDNFKSSMDDLFPENWLAKKLGMPKGMNAFVDEMLEQSKQKQKKANGDWEITINKRTEAYERLQRRLATIQATWESSSLDQTKDAGDKLVKLKEAQGGAEIETEEGKQKRLEKIEDEKANVRRQLNDILAKSDKRYAEAKEDMDNNVILSARGVQMELIDAYEQSAEAYKERERLMAEIDAARLAREQVLANAIIKVGSETYDDQKDMLQNWADTSKKMVKQMAIDWIEGEKQRMLADAASKAASAIFAKNYGQAALITGQASAATVVMGAAQSTIAGLATGGIVTGDGIYRMGEQNKREAVIPLETPQGRQALREAGGGAGGNAAQNVTLNIDGMKLAEIMINKTARGRAQGRF